jgi:hypothetical protein
LGPDEVVDLPDEGREELAPLFAKLVQGLLPMGMHL